MDGEPGYGHFYRTDNPVITGTVFAVALVARSCIQVEQEIVGCAIPTSTS